MRQMSDKYDFFSLSLWNIYFYLQGLKQMNETWRAAVCQCLTPVSVVRVNRLHSDCDDGKHRQRDGEHKRHTQSHRPDLSDNNNRRL